MDLPNLPNDIFLLIISYLPPRDSVVCRSVSRAWRTAFASEDASRYLMRFHFPRCREMRQTLQAPDQPQPSWARMFLKVARRYTYLRAAKPRLIEKIEVVQEARQKGLHRGVEPWNRWLRWNDSTAVFQYRDPTWCLDDGLLIYQENVSGCYVAYDLETRHRFPVPFDGTDRTVRRLRLACGVLIIEWCERESFHQLNDRETVHRHFATAFDVRRQRQSSSSSESAVSAAAAPWNIEFRSEWKIHFLGLPLNRHDRFFSAHTATHYALYLWQPDRSLWGEEEPLEQLIIWDISTPSPYRPSADPAGLHKPAPPDDGAATEGPVVVRRFSWRELEFLGLRQRHTPCLRELRLDAQNVYAHEEEHRWLAGQHSSLSPPRHHVVRCTGAPFRGCGPRWRDECCADGDVHLSFCPRAGSAARGEGRRRRAREAAHDDDDDDGGGGGARWAPCWRHEEFPYLTVSDVVDAPAGVRIVARQCFMMEALSAFVLPKISLEEDDGEEEEEEEVRFADDMWAQLMGKGYIAGDERWVVGEDTEGRITVVRF
ncbi:hypothetical protein F5X96DRAFT_354498 [Biscogniauxia mediterranea]|nr:hypothetical protein F5X96DRAFT_354498 [Biscogniauxia mediterranea]